MTVGPSASPSRRGHGLVTGASSGIGAAFAEAYGRRGLDLVLVSRSPAALERRAVELRAKYGVRVVCAPYDLSNPAGVRDLVAFVAAQDIEVEVLVNNAGYATHGRFETIDPALDHGQAMLNVVAVVDLCHAFLPAMVARNRGVVINVSSLGGFQPAPYLAVYAASKVFSLSFGEALAGELEGTGVRVLALCPGPVRTGFFTGLGSTDAAVGQSLSAEKVVTEALRALDRGSRVVVPGRLNALAAQASRVLPRRLITSIAKRSVGVGSHAQQRTRPTVDELSGDRDAP